MNMILLHAVDREKNKVFLGITEKLGIRLVDQFQGVKKRLLAYKFRVSAGNFNSGQGIELFTECGMIEGVQLLLTVWQGRGVGYGVSTGTVMRFLGQGVACGKMRYAFTSTGVNNVGYGSPQVSDFEVIWCLEELKNVSDLVFHEVI